MFKSNNFSANLVGNEVTDVEYIDIVAPSFDEAPVVVYNPHDAGCLIAAAILQGERGWLTFKAGDVLPVAKQFIWLGTEPNRKLFQDAGKARKSEHFVFMRGKHPMVAEVALWGTFKLEFANWTYRRASLDTFAFLLSHALGDERAEEFNVIMELANQFYDKPVSQGTTKQAIFSELCPVACVYKNVRQAIRCLRTSVKFVPAGITHLDVQVYLSAIAEVKESLKALRIDTVLVGGDTTALCCSTAISEDYWLVKRVIGFSYPYHFNLTVSLTGTRLDTNVVRVPDQHQDDIILR